MDRFDYDHRQHAVYARVRAMSPSRLRSWLEVFARHLPESRPLAVLDLGSGTGRFTPALRSAFRGPVYGVEPSVRMRRVAEDTAAQPGGTYLAGSAEEIRSTARGYRPRRGVHLAGRLPPGPCVVDHGAEKRSLSCTTQDKVAPLAHRAAHDGDGVHGG